MADTNSPSGSSLQSLLDALRAQQGGGGQQNTGTSAPDIAGATSSYGTTNTHPQGYNGLSWGQMEEQGLMPIANQSNYNASHSLPDSNVGVGKGAWNSPTAPAPIPPNGLPNQLNTGQPNPQTVNATPYTGNSIVDALSASGQPSAFADRAKLAGQYGIQDYTGTAAQNTDMLKRYQQGFNTAKATGRPAPSDSGTASAAVNAATPAPAQALETSPMDSFLNTTMATDPFFGNIMKQWQDYMSPEKQRTSLTEEYSKLMKDTGIQELDTKLMNMKNVIDGTEDDIRNEVVKAGGFATDSQVQALAGARNKQLIKNYNVLLDTRNKKQDYVTTMIGLEEKDRATADSRFDKMMNFGNQMLTYRDKMADNARTSYQNIASKVGYDGLYHMVQNDPHATQLVENTLGLGSGGLAQLATATATKDLQFVSGTANQPSGYFDKNTGEFTSYGGKSGGGNPTGSGTLGTSPTTGGNIPSALQPYLNTSSSGVQYVDASTLQGSASQKKALIDQASASGLKVITNKNTAADLINIQDANSKLDTVSSLMSNIGQPSWITRTLYGFGATKLAELSQSNPQKAAAGALQSIGLDILKAISGVQGFRGNQTAVQQVTEHLPKITDTQDVITQKIAYIKALISDREDAALGTTKKSASTQAPTLLQPAQIPSGYYQASDGLLYKK